MATAVSIPVRVLDSITSDPKTLHGQGYPGANRERERVQTYGMIKESEGRGRAKIMGSCRGGFCVIVTLCSPLWRLT